MKLGGAVPALMLAVALASSGCRDANVERSNTVVLGGPQPAREAAPPQLTDARGQVIPAPPAPAGSQPQVARLGDDAALALWAQDGQVAASSWSRAAGWSAPRPLEQIYGESRDPRIASNGQGVAMAVWRHTVGNIHSLRFSRFDANGWRLPDVLPGALPRPSVAGAPAGHDAPQLEMDAQGNVLAQWPSGFRANEVQVARYTPGEGWTRATSEPVASALNTAPSPPAPSSAR
jgi:hypothetical protein